MLVISQMVGQTFEIGNATVTILEVKGKRARLGVEAPREVKILRRNAKNHDVSAKRKSLQRTA